MAEPTPPDLYWYRADLVHAIDGDTAVVDVDLGFRHRWTIHVRLYGINAPELVGPNRLAGLAAQEHLEELLAMPGLMLHSHKDKPDKYGDRWLGEFFRDGVSLNERMVEAGHAVRYVP
jgi:endonuclease YncB( thermonuclease family)